jgi:hypothetical protein
MIEIRLAPSRDQEQLSPTIIDILSLTRRPRAYSRLWESRAPLATREILAAAVGFLWKYPFRELSIGTLMNRTSIRRTSFCSYLKGAFRNG